MLAWDFSLLGGDPPFKVAALGFGFPRGGLGAGLKTPGGKTNDSTAKSGKLTRFRFCRACSLPAGEGCDFLSAHG